ncbi:helix-hairpin-helix domain-containing protein [Motilimonas cestriensis]|uniref:Helix-hairpin-helix domain-containing protein n=1 Tax=Motilimonas cestriensis TaxID=2742685 RepID=A0ABS8W925_9GAMM|nr:helix-hairpin-helix domain-containing protein [Motilimonas cestriensis]MCE2595516.1 helix-hairpin-helix domain-containing protein [Motilimonas cestriensis]
MKLRTLIAASLFAVSSMGQLALAAETATDTAVTQESSAVSQQVININTATEDELTKIKGVGEKKSKAIIAYRKEIGQFKNVDQLLEVAGIGQSILDNNKDLLAVK